jgi:uncharacterized membrane protein YedE/YeeE
MERWIGLPVLSGVFALAVLLGAVASQTRFCTMGGVSDWLNIDDRGRMGAWFMAIAVALLGVSLLEATGTVGFGDTRPPYRSPGFAPVRYLLGGFMFGVGMVLASGCPTRNLIRFGNGSLKALVTLLVVAVCAYLLNQYGGYGLLFHSWLQYLALDLRRFGLPAQDLGSLVAPLISSDVGSVRLILGLVLAGSILLPVLRSPDVRRLTGNWLGGAVVGLCVVGGWYLTGGQWGREWQEEALWLDQPPVGVGVQSFTFVGPTGEVLAYLGAGGDPRWLTFGVVAVAGAIIGALLHGLVARRFRLEWFSSLPDAGRHIGGGVLMGVGGTLAMGCTVGQGITGVSTLALGSLLALAAIILGAATTLKVQYYRILYDDASLPDALLSGWVDLHLLPRGWRRLDAL